MAAGRPAHLLLTVTGRPSDLRRATAPNHVARPPGVTRLGQKRPDSLDTRCKTRPGRAPWHERAWFVLRNWVQQVEVDEGHRPGVTTAEAQRINEFEREVRELRRANEILRTASAFFAAAGLDRKLK